jgi:hypothetical protein
MPPMEMLDAILVASPGVERRPAANCLSHRNQARQQCRRSWHQQRSRSCCRRQVSSLLSPTLRYHSSPKTESSSQLLSIASNAPEAPLAARMDPQGPSSCLSLTPPAIDTVHSPLNVLVPPTTGTLVVTQTIVSPLSATHRQLLCYCRRRSSRTRSDLRH